MTYRPPSAATRLAVGLVVAAKTNVGAAAGHVGRDRHGARRAGARDDRCLLGVVLRVEHLRTAHRRARSRSASRSDRRRSPCRRAPAVRSRARRRTSSTMARSLASRWREHDVRPIDANHGAVRRNDDDVEAVGLGAARSRRPAPCRSCPHKLRIAAQEALQRDRAEDAAVGTPLEAFLRLERALAGRRASAGPSRRGRCARRRSRCGRCGRCSRRRAEGGRARGARN